MTTGWGNRFWVKLALAVIVLAVSYIAAPGPGPVEQSGLWENAGRWSSLSVILDQANRGNFFQCAPGISFRQVSGDLGLPYLAVMAIWLVRQVAGTGWKADYLIYYDIQFIVLLITALLFTARHVPSKIYYGVLVALAAGFATHTLFWHWSCYWAPPLAVLVTLAFLLTQGTPAARLHPGFAVACGGAAGLLGLLRQDAGLISRVAVLFFIGLVGLVWLWEIVRRIPAADREPRIRHLRMLAGSALFLAGTAIAPQAFQLHTTILQRLTGVDHTVGIGAHGIWGGPYASLGIYQNDNPYGIAWDDAATSWQVKRENPALHDANDLAFDYTQRALYFKVLLDDPIFAIPTQILNKFPHMISMDGRAAWWLVGLVLLFAIFHTGWRQCLRPYDAAAMVAVMIAASPVPMLILPHPRYSAALNFFVFAAPLMYMAASGPEVSRRLLSRAWGWGTLAPRRAAFGGLVVALASLAVTAALGLAGLWVASQLRHHDAFRKGTLAEFMGQWRQSPLIVGVSSLRDMSAATRHTVVEDYARTFGLFAGGAGRVMDRPPDAPFDIRDVTWIPGQIAIFGIARHSLAPADFWVHAVPEARSGTANQPALLSFHRRVPGIVAGQSYILMFDMSMDDGPYARFDFGVDQRTADSSQLSSHSLLSVTGIAPVALDKLVTTAPPGSQDH